jgi:hypothetical protein
MLRPGMACRRGLCPDPVVTGPRASDADRGPDPAVAGSQVLGPDRAVAGSQASGPDRAMAGNQASGPDRAVAGSQVAGPDRVVARRRAAVPNRRAIPRHALDPGQPVVLAVAGEVERDNSQSSWSRRCLRRSAWNEAAVRHCSIAAIASS